MWKFIKMLIGVLLLPACWAVSRAVYTLYQTSAESTATSGFEIWALPVGFVLWVALFFLLPRPFRTYVLAHELTHALWALIMDVKVMGIKVSKESGHVTLSKTNFIINLAPYFFPLYTVMVIASYYILSIFFDMEKYYLFWLALIGLSWGFHFTFTISTLLQHQTDIKAYGHLFSYTVIYLLNILGIGFWIVIVSSATFEQMIFFGKAHIGAIFAFSLGNLTIFFNKITQ